MCACIYIYIYIYYSDLKQPEFVCMHIYVYILLDDIILRFGTGPVLKFVVRISVLKILLRIIIGHEHSILNLA